MKLFIYGENSNLGVKDYATITQKDGWSVNYDTDIFAKYCKICNGIIYFSAPIRSYTAIAANAGVNVATISKAPSHVQIIVGRHTNSDGQSKGSVYGYINRGGEVYVYSASAIISGDTLYIKSIPAPW